MASFIDTHTHACQYVSFRLEVAQFADTLAAKVCQTVSVGTY
jgi:hypothetical protein